MQKSVVVYISEWLTAFKCSFSVLGRSLIKVFNFDESKFMDKTEVHASSKDMYAFILSVCVGHIGEFFFSVIQLS